MHLVLHSGACWIHKTRRTFKLWKPAVLGDKAGARHGRTGVGLCGTKARVATTPAHTTDLITRIGTRVGYLWILHACAALVAAQHWGYNLVD